MPTIVKKKIDDIVQKDKYYFSRSHFFYEAINQMYPVIEQFVNDLNDINKNNKNRSLSSIMTISLPLNAIDLLDKFKGIDVFLPSRSEIVRLITIFYLFNYIKNTKDKQKSDKIEVEIDDNTVLVPFDNGETKRYRKVYK